ncbi:hypothetical protein, partial [Priestia megaterium]|uniref:hypothetical protein n=1 Tax=Priestia megaterium TaxID=1404 RepID=UPI001F4187A6
MREEDLGGKEREEMVEVVVDDGKGGYNEKEEELGEEEMGELEKVVVVRGVDCKWMDDMDRMDEVREGMQVGGHGQRDPVGEYE